MKEEKKEKEKKEMIGAWGDIPLTFLVCVKEVVPFQFLSEIRVCSE